MGLKEFTPAFFLKPSRRASMAQLAIIDLSEPMTIGVFRNRTSQSDTNWGINDEVCQNLKSNKLLQKSHDLTSNKSFLEFRNV